MFAWRFSLYPPDRIVVLTKAVEHSHDFDKNLNYLIKRVPLQWKGPRKFKWLGLVWELLRAGIPLAIQQKVEVVQCARPFPEGLAGYVIAKLLLKKLVINSHGDDIVIIQNYIVERFLMKLSIRFAHLNLANSTFTESLIKQFGGEGIKTAVINPGFDPRSLQIEAPEKVSRLRECLTGSPIILTVGRLQSRKGQDNVIRALPKVIEYFPKLKYAIIGPEASPGLENKLCNLAKQFNVSQHVVMAGEIDNKELSIYYKACDLFIMPNRLESLGDIEGFGIVFLEAGFLGKPVIGGNSGGVPDAVLHRKTGLLVDGTSVEEIAQSIIKILSDKQLARKMGEQGREFALSKTHEKVFEQYQALMTNSGL